VEELVNDIYRELYREAEPSADFDEIKDGKLQEEGGYKEHFLEFSRQREIVDRHCEEANLTKTQERQIRTEIHLGASPTTNPDHP
jgi:hypothetical protein